MDRNSIIAVVFVISVIVAGGSLRVLAAAGVEKDPPSPTPLPLMKGDAPKKNLSDSKPSHTLTKSDPNLTDSPKLNSSTPGDPPVSSLTPPGSDGKNHKDKNKDGTSTPISDTSEKKVQEDEVCKDSAKNCKKGKLTACFQDSGQASKQLFLLVKNEGEDTLKVNISVPASAKIDKKQLPLYKHTHEKINISVNDGENLKIVVSAGNGDCILQLQRTHASAGAPASAAEFFKRLPSYATHMTPIYGAYLFFLTALIIGGTWACCKFGKRGRRDGGGVPYQELEMGLPQSSSAVGVDSADGWDQGWDDDWEEEKGTSRMPEVRRAGNVSANGLTSRSPNRDFKSGTNKVPKIAEKGEEGAEMWLDLELKLVADVGIVGAPNAGKSTLLSAISAAEPTIANYPFTTLLPNLGVVSFDYDNTMVVADLPGLLEGAHRGFGLGHEFLRHTERCSVLVHVVDGSGQQPEYEFDAVRLELELFSPELAEKPFIVAYNKMDLPEASEKWASFEEYLQDRGIHPFSMSAMTRQGTHDVVCAAYELLRKKLEAEESAGWTDPVNLNHVAETIKKQRSASMSDFEISHDSSSHTWHVVGAGIQRFVQMTNWQYTESLRRFQHVLEACGVNKSLIKLGVKEGDTVIVGEMEMVWSNAVDKLGPANTKKGSGSIKWPQWE